MQVASAGKEAQSKQHLQKDSQVFDDACAADLFWKTQFLKPLLSSS